jgi:hypothetical protein
MLLHMRAASSLTDDFSICFLVHVFGGCIGSLAVDLLVPAFLLSADQ